MKSIIFTVIVINSAAWAQIAESTNPYHTFKFAGYTVNYYLMQVTLEENYVEVSVNLCDKELMRISDLYPGQGVYPLPHYYGVSPLEPSPRLVEDINGDGLPELIIMRDSDSHASRTSVFIYRLDTLATEIANLDGINVGLKYFLLFDFDDDYHPELIFNDVSFKCHPPGCDWGAYPFLVWQWDGTKYRVANYKLCKQIMKILYHADSSYFINTVINMKNDTVKIRNYSPGKPTPHLAGKANYMITLVYLGFLNEAKLVLDYSWAESDSTRADFEKVFWEDLEGTYYWDQLRESNW